MDFLDAKSIQRGLPGMLADKQIGRMKSAAESAAEGKDSEKLKSLSKQFESIMTHQLLSAMRSTVPKSELTGGFSSEMYQSMMDQEIATEVSKKRGLGLADMVHRQLVRLDQKSKNEKSANPGIQPPATVPSGAKGLMMKAVKSYRGSP